MQIDELPAGEQTQNPDLDMNQVVGTHDILMLCRISAFSGGTSFATQP